MTTRVAVDAMGGDHAPGVVVRGVLQALREYDDVEVILVGDEGRVHQELDRSDTDGLTSRLRVVHASQVVAMDDPPVEALKAKKDSSLVRMASLAAQGEADAVLSAGNTGACAAACQLSLKTLRFVTRPGIAVTIPAFHGPFVLCDVGANIQAKPKHLYEYAVMARAYAESVIGISNPRVALISIGEERGKGTSLIKRAHRLMEEDPSLNFVGNAEGRELFEDRCDVAVCDGFVGNIILKFVEGLAGGLFQTIAREFEDEAPDRKDRLNEILQHVWQRHDYSQYGGAPLLGIDGTCVICHGRSSEFAFRNAVRVAREFVRVKFNEVLSARMS